ncbi:cation transporter [Brevirhabdus pacifica]|uniref:Cation transporter n=1 Tax=Brevirhabdus pacifica TaxID=1267768 RepID=A0A1U7DH83_9RHOB|nr:cation diffusion facilitator family transporter [Brevirhabdus pacifica]APX89321.1 cation transporter [Brevirhabdus pacifica]PJJ86057.1 cobalt-zinc-cadmium efflux system protein [Brevirhabdus pacifica]
MTDHPTPRAQAPDTPAAGKDAHRHDDDRGHGKGKGHDHAPGHSHDHAKIDSPARERAVAWAALLTGGFMLAEVAGGLVSGSLALLADAGHMLTDFASLILAWLAFRIARRPADWKRTFGFDRFSVLAAFVNGISLFAIALWILIEAIRRFRDPVEVMGGLMLWVALGGLVVNLLAFWVLTRSDDSDNLNVRAAALHVAGDLLGSVGALVASIVIIFTGWTPIDPILSVLVAAIILRSAWRVVRESGHILLEGTPNGTDPRAIARTVQEAIPELVRLHHMHAWSITQERPMFTAQAQIDPGAHPEEVRDRIRAILKEKFGFDHVTIEVERLAPGTGAGAPQGEPGAPTTGTPPGHAA